MSHEVTTTSLPFRLIRSDQAREMFGGISTMTLWRWINDKGFPAPIKICGRNFFDLDDVLSWHIRQTKYPETTFGSVLPPMGEREDRTED